MNDKLGWLCEETCWENDLKKERIRVICVDSTSLDIPNAIKKIGSNVVVHDLRNISGNWKEHDTIYKNLMNQITFARAKNQKHVIVTNAKLPVGIKNCVDAIVRHEEGYATFSWDVITDDRLYTKN